MESFDILKVLWLILGQRKISLVVFLVLLFHKKTTKLVLLWPNMDHKCIKVLTTEYFNFIIVISSCCCIYIISSITFLLVISFISVSIYQVNILLYYCNVIILNLCNITLHWCYATLHCCTLQYYNLILHCYTIFLIYHYTERISL